jgi:hypothetical protein
MSFSPQILLFKGSKLVNEEMRCSVKDKFISSPGKTFHIYSRNFLAHLHNRVKETKYTKFKRLNTIVVNINY